MLRDLESPAGMLCSGHLMHQLVQIVHDVCRREVEEVKLSCGTTEAALQAARVQDELMASQLRAAKHALECEKDETQALRQQASPSSTIYP